MSQLILMQGSRHASLCNLGFWSSMLCPHLLYFSMIWLCAWASDHSCLLVTSSEFKKPLMHCIFPIGCCVFKYVVWLEHVARKEGMEGNLRCVCVCVQLPCFVNKFSGLERTEGTHTMWTHGPQVIFLCHHYWCGWHAVALLWERPIRSKDGDCLPLIPFHIPVLQWCFVCRCSVRVGKGTHSYKQKTVYHR